MVALGNRVSEQLARLGIPAELVGAQLGNLSPAKLAALSSNLNVAFGAQALSTNKFAGDVQDSRWNIAGALSNPTPRESLKDRGVYARRSYFQNRTPRHESAREPFSGLLNKYTKTGALMARKLQADEAARQTFERRTALTVVQDGRADGAVSVSAMTSNGSSSSPSGGVPQTFWDMFMAMDQAVMNEAARLGSQGAASSELYGASGSSGGYNNSPSGYLGGLSADGDAYFGSSATYLNGTDADSEGSTDEQVLVVKRMMDKRNQMYDLFKSVLEKHNESAKTAIGNMRA
jgi:hypothetical protein